MPGHDDPETLIDELESVLLASEQRWRVGVVLKCYDLLWRRADGGGVAIGERCRHRAPVCLLAKQADYAACEQACLLRLPETCDTSAGPFQRPCHAGVREVIIPIRDGGRVVATISLGPLAGSRGASGPRVERVHILAELLRGYAQYWQERYRRAREADGADLATRTVSAIDRHLATGARLDDVARELHASPAWASRLIARHCGCSFSQLRDRRRLQLACEALRDSEDAIDAIATRCGFPHPTYFYQVFRKRFGTTPARWRQEARRRAEV